MYMITGGTNGMMEGTVVKYGTSDSGIACDWYGSTATVENHEGFGNILYQGGHVKGYPGVPSGSAAADRWSTGWTKPANYGNDYAPALGNK